MICFSFLSSFLSPRETPKFTSSPCHLKTSTQEAGAAPNVAKRSFKYELKYFAERQAIKLNDLKYCKLFGLTLLISKDDECCSSNCNNGLVDKSSSAHHFKHAHKHYHMPKSQDDTELLYKFIPITIRNYVSIFDSDKGTFLGPRYEGKPKLNF